MRGNVPRTIQTLRELLPPLFARKKFNTLQDRLKRAGQECFTAETLLAMRRSMLLEDYFFKDFLHWAVPKWQASELASVESKLRLIDVHNVQSLYRILLPGASWHLARNRLRVLGETGFKPGTLHAFRRRAKQIVDFCKIKVNLHTLAGRLLVTLCVQDSTTGADLKEAATPYLEPDVLVRNVLLEDGCIVGRNQAIGELCKWSYDSTPILLVPAMFPLFVLCGLIDAFVDFHDEDSPPLRTLSRETHCIEAMF